MPDGVKKEVFTPPPRFGSSREGSPSSGLFRRKYGVDGGAQTDFKGLQVALDALGGGPTERDPRTGSDRDGEARAAAGEAVAAITRMIETARCWQPSPEGLRPDKPKRWASVFGAAGRSMAAVVSPLRLAIHTGPTGSQVPQDLDEFRELVLLAEGEDAAAALTINADLAASADAVEARLDELDHAATSGLLGDRWPDRTERALERFAIDSGVALPRTWTKPVTLADVARAIGGKTESLVTRAVGRGVRVELFRGANWCDLAELIDRGGYHGSKLQKLQEMLTGSQPDPTQDSTGSEPETAISAQKRRSPGN